MPSTPMPRKPSASNARAAPAIISLRLSMIHECKAIVLHLQGAYAGIIVGALMLVGIDLSFMVLPVRVGRRYAPPHPNPLPQGEGILRREVDFISVGCGK